MKNLSNFWPNLPLGTKLAAFATVLVLAVIGILTVRTIQREQAAFQVEIESQAELVVNTIAGTVPDDLYLRNIDELDELADIIAEDESITLVQFFDADGFLVADASLPSPILATEPDRMGEALLDAPADRVTLERQSGQIVAGRPIILGREPIGAVAVGISTAALDAKIARVRDESLITALVLIVVAGAVSFLLTRYVTRPLSSLTSAAAQLSASNTVSRVPERAEDEVGQLARTFNRMADAVQARERDLKALTETLEDQVKARTAELESRNEDLSRTNIDLVEARKQAEQATRLKSQFLATISHELRTPLNGIMGYSQVMLIGVAGEMNELLRDNTERILANSYTLLELINNLLDIAKIESGRMELVHKPVVLRDWIKQIIGETEGLVKAKGLEFETRINESLPTEIIGDPDRLKQIVVNLISNAVKFTDEGHIEVELTHKDDQKLIISVKDTGIGIPSHMQETIFDEFRQVDGTSQRRYGGTGLGLAIVRNLCVMMDGTIRVESTVGKGSLFTVQLPLLAQSVYAEAGPKREVSDAT